MRPNYRQNAQRTFRNRSQNRNRNKNYNNDYTRGRSRDRNNSRSVPRRREESRARSNSKVSTNCNQKGVIDVGNMIISHLNALIPQLTRRRDYEDIDPASLQMMTQNYGPVDSEGEVEYLNL